MIFQTERHEYTHGDVTLEGFVARPRSCGPRPAVMILHTWRGIGPSEEARAVQFARLGYIAFCADMYGRGVRPQDPMSAREEMMKYRDDRALLRARVRAGLDAMTALPEVDPAKRFAVGYCFGGGCALELARSGADLAAVVSFHGHLDSPTPEDAAGIRSRILVHHGANDPLVPDTDLLAFLQEMRRNPSDWKLSVHGHAVHAFTSRNAGNDPSTGLAYDARADERSWTETLAFFGVTPPGI